MADTSEKKFVPQAGNKLKYTDPWGDNGRGIYLGSYKVFNLASGEILRLDPKTNVEPDDGNAEVKPVVVVNEARIKLSTIAVGVFLANLISGVLLVLLALLLGLVK